MTSADVQSNAGIDERQRALLRRRCAMPTLAWACLGATLMNDQDQPHRKTCVRINTPGHAHFVTFSCFHRQPFLSKDRSCQWLADAIAAARNIHQFDLWAYVFMPEHAHLLLFPRNDDYNMSAILSALKQPVAKRAIAFVQREAPEFAARMADGESLRFWQRGGGYDANLWTPAVIHAKVEYIHLNPVRRGLCERPRDWAWSSVHEYLDPGAGPIPLNLPSLPPA